MIFFINVESRKTKSHDLKNHGLPLPWLRSTDGTKLFFFLQIVHFLGYWKNSNWIISEPYLYELLWNFVTFRAAISEKTSLFISRWARSAYSNLKKCLFQLITWFHRNRWFFFLIELFMESSSVTHIYQKNKNSCFRIIIEVTKWDEKKNDKTIIMKSELTTPLTMQSRFQMFLKDVTAFRIFKPLPMQ